MIEDFFQGYKGASLEILKKYGVRVWGQVEANTTRGLFSGTVLPRAENDDDQHIVLKMNTGYNVGINISTLLSMKETGYKKAQYKILEKEFPFTTGLPRVKLFGTGGTIASRLDYRTGAVIPAFSPGELYGTVPELAEICNLETEKIFAIFSENMGPKQYITLAQAIAREVESGIDGIVIGHGTDTIQHTASALTFMCQNLPVPVVLVGSQRSSDRPSSDAALNLMYAMKAAGTSDIAEVMVCMFGPTSDEYGLLHKGTRVRKMHSSYRSTFRTIGDIPMAMVNRHKVTPIHKTYNKRRNDKSLRLLPYFSDEVTMLYYYPGIRPDTLDALVDAGYRGVILVGTGLGHVNKDLYPAIERAHSKGVHMFMTLQTIWGYANMFVYDTGRDLMAKGIVPVGNMLPETAWVKLSWVLGQTNDSDEVKRLMLSPVNDEITPREPFSGYLVYQGGIPEVETFVKEVHK
ncbi:Glu-tRNA(Gln) amidotransferase subunit GatD [Bacteroidales bacterium]